MRDPARIKRILSKIEEAWMCNLDQRLGQLLCNISKDFEYFTFACEDDRLDTDLTKYLEDVRHSLHQTTIADAVFREAQTEVTKET